VPPGILISRKASIVGLASGSARDAEDTLNFAAQHKVYPQVRI
jgi:D-arabinose 1-dehydrogenase-like Zn-dependent alcohol dehydrogenase